MTNLAQSVYHDLDEYIANITYQNEKFPGTLEIMKSWYEFVNNDEDGSAYIEDNYRNYKIFSVLYSEYLDASSRYERFSDASWMNPKKIIKEYQ